MRNRVCFAAEVAGKRDDRELGAPRTSPSDLRCAPETTERLSHGDPTFFVRKKVIVMISNNHHNDGQHRCGSGRALDRPGDDDRGLAGEYYEPHYPR